MSEGRKKNPDEINARKTETSGKWIASARKAEATRRWKEENKETYLAQQAEDRRYSRSLLPSQRKVRIQGFLAAPAFSAIHEMRDGARSFATISEIIEELLSNPFEADRMVREATKARRT